MVTQIDSQTRNKRSHKYLGRIMFCF